MSKSIIYNTAFASLERAVTILSYLLLLPFMLKYLGETVYGIWVVFNLVGSYLVLTQFGLAFSFEKYIAEFESTGDKERIRRLVCSSWYALLVIAAAVFCLVFFLRRPILGFFKIEQTAGDYLTAFTGLIFVTLVGMIFNVFTAVSKGFQRFDYFSIIQIAGKILYFFLAIAGLKSGYGILSVVAAVGANFFFTAVANMVITWKLVGTIPLNPRYFDFQLLRQLFGYGIKLQIASLAFWITQNFDKILISRYLGLTYVTYYDIGARLVYAVREIPMLFFNVLVPRASELNAQGDSDRIRHYYLFGTKTIAAFSFVCLSCLFVAGPAIYTVWLGRPPESEILYVFYFLTASSFLNVCSGVASSILRGTGHVEVDTITYIIISIVNMAVSAGCLILFGFNGPVLGTSLAYCLSVVIILVWTNSILKIRQMAFFKETFMTTTLAFPVATAAGFALWHLIGRQQQNFGFEMALIGIPLIVITGTYAAAYRLTDRKYLAEILSVIKAVRR